MTDIQTSMRPHVRAAVRASVRASSPRPAAARRAAKDFDKHVLRAVPAEIRWAFSPPRTWLMGVVANLILAAALLLVQPLTPQGRHHQHFDWVILVGAYFSSFILADVTTTNLLGADHHRVRQALSDGTPLWRVLLIKDLALLVLVGLPTLAAAAALTLWLESPGRLSVTVPNVAVPILSWLGIGNFISALYPVTAEPLYRRWRRRRDVRGTAIWTAALTLPYVLYFVADPMDSVEHQLLWTQLPAAIGPILGRDTKSLVHFGVALVVWVAGTVAAVLWARKRGVRSR